MIRLVTFRKKKEKRTDETVKRHVRRSITTAAAMKSEPVYPGKLGKKIPWAEVNECIRNSGADPAAMTRFIEGKYREAFALLIEHYAHGCKKTADLATVWLDLVFALALDHVPAFQIEKPRGRPKKNKQRARNSPEVINAAFKRVGWAVPKGRPTYSGDPGAPLSEQHSLALVHSVEAEMNIHGSAAEAINKILTAEAKARGKPVKQHVKDHSSNVQRRYLKAKKVHRT